MRPFSHSLAALGALGALPLGALALALRPEWRVGLGERLGGAPRGPAGAVWVHAASAGEARAALGLLDALQHAGREVFASSMTTAGRAVLRRQRPQLACGLAPLDHPWCAERALARVRPDLLALVETELWPQWIAAAARRGVAVAVVSGRISDRAFARYQRVRPWTRRLLRRLDAIGARSERDAARFVALGAPVGRVCVSGDLKAEPLAFPPADPALAAALEGVPCFVAGSTHPGEERAALDALAACEREGIGLSLVVAPRQLSRCERLLGELRRSGRVVHRRSELGGARVRAGEVLLLDSMGELGSVYSLAEVAFVGGTLAPVGGHNLLEPAFAGCPVLFGPHLADAESAARLLEKTGCGARVSSATGLAQALLRQFRQREAARARFESGRVALEAQRGVAARSAALLLRVLAAARCA